MAMPGGDGRGRRRRRGGAIRRNWTVRARQRAKNSIGTFVRPRWPINQHQSRGKKEGGGSGCDSRRNTSPCGMSRNLGSELWAVGYFLRGELRCCGAITVGRNFIVVVFVRHSIRDRVSEFLPSLSPSDPRVVLSLIRPSSDIHSIDPRMFSLPSGLLLILH